MIYEHTNYRTYLKAWLAGKIAENPAFSLRAMARKCGVAPSTLSEVLKGVKNLSSEKAMRIAEKVGLHADEQEYFCRLVQFESTKSPEARSALFTKLQTQAQTQRSTVNDLSVDVFKVIADWYHFPILEMTGLANFRFTPPNIAKRLGITTLEAEVAIERLTRLELLEQDAKKQYRKTNSRWVAQAQKPNESLRQFHRQMLGKAIESLSTQTPKEKVVGSETFAIDTRQVEEARKITNEYFDRMVALSDRAKNRDEVYHLGVQFFKLTQSSERKTAP